MNLSDRQKQEFLHVHGRKRSEYPTKITSVKFVVERKDGKVTTWRDVLDMGVEDILLSVADFKQWRNGKVVEAYIEYEAHGEYQKAYLDCDRLSKTLQMPEIQKQTNASDRNMNIFRFVYNFLKSKLPIEIVFAEYRGGTMTIKWSNGAIEKYEGFSTVWHKHTMMERASTSKEVYLSEIYTYIKKWGNPYPAAHKKEK